MQIERTNEIPDVCVLKTDVYFDERGYFMETHRTSALAAFLGQPIEFVQGNVSSSLPWALRGMHYQMVNPQGKLVRCLKGSAYDVAVDMREGSRTYRKWVGVLLDEQNARAVWVPPGFAHGILAMAQGCLLHYECTTYYDDASARSLRWNDPTIGVTWPFQMNMTQPRLLSQKDRAAALFPQAEKFKVPVAA